MFKLIIYLLLVLNLLSSSFSQSHKVLESNSSYIKIEFNFENAYSINEKVIDGIKFNTIDGKELNVRKPGVPWLPDYRVSIGIPHNSDLKVKILSIEQDRRAGIFIMPTPDSLTQPHSLLNYEQDVYNSNQYFPVSSASVDGDFIMRYAHIAAISIAPYQFNPVTRDLLITKKIVVQIDFNQQVKQDIEVVSVNDNMTDEILQTSVINYEIAKNFIVKKTASTISPLSADSYWYNPVKDYYKIYLNQKGVYRVTYDWLINSGVPANTGLQEMRLELYCNGESIPIDVVDADQNNSFNSGDFFQFVGEPAKPTDQFTRMNIYNRTNVYWFSYQADTNNYYKSIDGFPTGNSPFIANSIKILQWEEDRNFQHLGHALNDQRDYWYWGGAEAINGIPTYRFEHNIVENIWNDFVVEKPQVKIKIGLHGLTNVSCQSSPSLHGHNTTVYFNFKPIGSIEWDNQESAEFQKDFYLAFSTLGGGDTAQIYWDASQNLIVQQVGDICPDQQNDVILVNYLHFEYWRWHKANSNYFYFTSPPNNYQDNQYYLWLWEYDNMKIYIPSRGEMVVNPLITNDADKSVRFIDTIDRQTDYYCVSNDYFILPDSIIKDIPSDLRYLTNGADYIIIKHPLFTNAAERLAEYRSNNLSGFSTPRVKVVDINEIYDEFSFGLLDPLALRAFVKYAFENWQQPAPEFVVLFGDASYDTRRVYDYSRLNFIPSIPFHASEFGRLPSDNKIVAVVGNDAWPDLALGRLTCETIEEANILVDKIISYPSDNSKVWKENVLLLASGLNYNDQISHGFNNASKTLENNYIRLNGVYTTKVFNFPEPQDIEFLGSGPRMREEINRGASIVNYYGHGGGGQWDLIFRTDDLYELNNGGRLPVALSITCYTAHFDNATAFGEVFIRIPNKGAIGFWGSVGLTYWSTGQNLNKSLFNQIFNFKNYVIGKAILSAKTGISGGNYDEMIAQLSYLGDPAIELTLPKYPDFLINSFDISISPANPLVEDTVQVSIKIKNLGVVFRNDTVTVQVYKNIVNSENLLAELKRPSFGDLDSLTVPWIPTEAGLYSLIVVINEKDTIWENDHSDNTASASFAVFSFGEPNIVKPLNSSYSSNGSIEFTLVDIGSLFDRTFSYLIEIDTTLSFNSSVKISSPVLTHSHQIVNWHSPILAKGEYFWRAIIYDNLDTNMSQPRSYSITTVDTGQGFLSKNVLLKQFIYNNVKYSPEFASLVLNTEVKPPRPDNNSFLDSIPFSLPIDSTQPITFTIDTDGKYFYYGEYPFWDSVSNIYKIGTGINGSEPGHNYGSIPNIAVPIYGQLFYKDGFLYVCTGSVNNLLQINPENGDTNRVQIQDSLLWTLGQPTQYEGCYFYYDGTYLYNLAIGTALYPDKFILRKFDPSTNWQKVGEDVVFNGSTIARVMSFVVVNGYLIIYENSNALYLRRYRLSDGVFEEEWPYSIPTKDFYTFTYDYNNDLIYFCKFRPFSGTYTPGFYRYGGTYKDATGSILSQDIGPASKWNLLSYDIDNTGSLGTYHTTLIGRKTNDRVWETLATNIPSQLSIDTINASIYDLLRVKIDMIDSSFGASEPLKFKSLKVNYTPLPEIVISPDEYSFSQDTTLQGFPVDMQLKVRNVGYTSADSLKLDVYLNNADTAYFYKVFSVEPDSIYTLNETLITDKLLYESPVSKIGLKVVATNKKQEFYTFNNIVENQFYVSRDSLRPELSVTFDGQEIVNEDIISAKPEIVISLRDNSPLHLTENMFTLIYTYYTTDGQIIRQLNGTDDNLVFNSTPYPNSEATYIWTPYLNDGKHKLEILAKDSSGNYVDTTAYGITFYVYNQADLKQVYNYPNPFKDDTYFTFELRGFEEESARDVQIKVFTVAGRLIKDFTVPASQLQPGFNRVYWDGKDQDGDIISNGLYFYKVIARLKGETKSVTQKLAKIK